MNKMPPSDSNLPVIASQGQLVRSKSETLPAMIEAAGAAGRFAWEEFLYGDIASEHTRKAYGRAVHQFLAWCEAEAGIVELSKVTPRLIRGYFDQHPGSAATKKQHLSALRHCLDLCVTRHVLFLNPALSVRGERLQVIEGKTPEISVKECRALLQSIETETVIGLRDRAIVATLIYTAVRVGAVSRLDCGDFYPDGAQWMLRFAEKRGKSREIPVRHNLQEYLEAYIGAAGMDLEAQKRGKPIFRAAIRREKRLSDGRLETNDICRMVKRRMKAAELPSRLSAHSFRVMAITDLLSQDVPLEDVQHLAGHADPRTTRLYDRRHKKITRNIVERISV